MTTRDTLAELERLYQAATPGEWWVLRDDWKIDGRQGELIDSGTDFHLVIGDQDDRVAQFHYEECVAEANANFCAALHNAWPVLIAALREMAEERDETPIDEAFANSLSAKQRGENGDVWVLGVGDTGHSAILCHREDEWGEYWWLTMAGVKLQMIVTRGHVRQLCKALGIPLPDRNTR